MGWVNLRIRGNMAKEESSADGGIDRRDFLRYLGVGGAALGIGSSSCKSGHHFTGGDSEGVGGTDRGAEYLLSYVRNDLTGNSWLIGNGLVEREVRFNDEIGLQSVRWLHKVTGTDLLGRSRAENKWGNEFSFKVSGVSLAGAHPPPSYWKAPPIATFDLLGSDTQGTTPAGKRLEVKLKAKSHPLEVSVFYAVYDGHPVVRKWIAITNCGRDNVTLERLIFESVGLAAGPSRDLELCRFYGIRPQEIFGTGRYEDPAIVQRNSRTGEGLIVMNEAPGCMKRTEMEGWGSGPVEVMYDTDLFPFERQIKPDETFTSAASSIAFFSEGRGLSDPGWVMPSYTSEVIKRTGAAWRPLWIYNSWEPLHHGINAQNMSESVPVAVRMGLDVFDLDEGWEVQFGDNVVNQKKFPEGLAQLRAALEQGGVRLGLDQPLAVVGADSPIFHQHPEWQRRGRNGKPIFSRITDPVMCLASRYRDHAASRLSELIADNHLKFVQIDLTTNFDSYGAEYGCWAENHDHHTWAESLVMCYEGIKYVMDKLHRDHPDVVLDLTFETWGNYKHGIDYAHIAIADLNYLSNVDDSSPESAGPLQARTLLYERALTIPTENMDIGNILANSHPIEERFATAIGASPLLNGDLRKLTAAEQDWWRRKINWFKELRRDVPINQGFFPLGCWRQPNATTWDGFARLSRQGEGIVAIFRNDSHVASVEVQLPAFPQGSYTVRSVMTEHTLGRFSGRQLKRGITLKLPEQYKVEVLEILKG